MNKEIEKVTIPAIITLGTMLAAICAVISLVFGVSFFAVFGVAIVWLFIASANRM